MTDEQYDRLVQSILGLAADIKDIRAEMATKVQVEAVYDLLDKNIGEHQRQEEERAAMSAQLDRLSRIVQAQ